MLMLIGHMCWSNLSKEISKWGGAFLIIIILTIVITIIVMIMSVSIDANLIFLPDIRTRLYKINDDYVYIGES